MLLWVAAGLLILLFAPFAFAGGGGQGILILIVAIVALATAADLVGPPTAS